MADPILNLDKLYIDVEVYGGSDIPTAIYQMTRLASRIGISVWATLNGVRTLARPGDDAQMITAEWSRALKDGSGYASQSRPPMNGERK